MDISHTSIKADKISPTRCQWSLRSPEELLYHDAEWGVPEHNEKRLFEFLLLETFQSGLTWTTILKKRPAFSEAFYEFCFERVAAMNEKDVHKLLTNAGIVRNRAKILAAITNAKAFKAISKRPGGFDRFIWSFTGGKTIHHHFSNPSEIPSRTPESHTMSYEMKKHGFTFIGPVVCYAFMQAIGMVNDHTTNCFRYLQLLP